MSTLEQRLLAMEGGHGIATRVTASRTSAATRKVRGSVGLTPANMALKNRRPTSGPKRSVQCSRSGLSSPSDSQHVEPSHRSLKRNIGRCTYEHRGTEKPDGKELETGGDDRNRAEKVPSQPSVEFCPPKQ